MKSVNLQTHAAFSQSVCTTLLPFTPLSCSLRRRTRISRTRRNRNAPIYTIDDNHLSLSKPSSDSKLQTVIDLQHFSNQAKFHVNHFISLSKEAYSDLRTLITIDPNRKIIVSCRRSTLEFTGCLLLLSFFIVFAFRNLFKLGLALSGRFSGSSNVVIRRRDRSLGGREVIVGKEIHVTNRKNAKLLGNPLSMAREEMMTASGVSDRAAHNMAWGKVKLPKWWPVLVSPPMLTMDKDEYQREANRLIRALMDNRMGGKDIMENDIIQLRRLCRTSGAQISIVTTNTRDSFYRTSVDFVLNVCSSAPNYSTSVEIDGEDARQFIAGLAENMRLDRIRAAKIVSAAVAARTRSCFLQAWALEMQGKHHETMMELSKICLLLRIFPPEEASPEMEMVALGLEKHLKEDQREFLMNMLCGICDEESCRIAAEALGLRLSPNGVSGQQENLYS